MEEALAFAGDTLEGLAAARGPGIRGALPGTLCSQACRLLLGLLLRSSEVLSRLLGFLPPSVRRDNGNAFLAWFELKENFPFSINIYSSCGCKVERFRVLVFN